MLENEVSSLKQYIELEYYRLEESFDYSIHLDDHLILKTEKTIPFVIQPFVENAIHHGLKNKEGKGKLSLSLSLEQDFIKVVIEDDGIGRAAARNLQTREKSRQQSHGINIIRERLRFHNMSKRKEDTIIEDLTDADGKPAGTRVTVYIKRIEA